MYGNHSSTFTLHFKELKLPEITGIKTTWLFVKTTDLLVDGMDTHAHPVYNYLFTDTERFFPLTKKLFHFLFLFTRTIFTVFADNWRVNSDSNWRDFAASVDEFADHKH